MGEVVPEGEGEGLAERKLARELLAGPFVVIEGSIEGLGPTLSCRTDALPRSFSDAEEFETREDLDRSPG